MAEKLARVNVTIEKDLLKKIDKYAEDKYEDRSTAMRQLLHAGLQENQKKDIAYAYESGRITLREAAELFGTDYASAQDILADAGVPVSDLTEKEVSKRKKDAKKDKY